MMLEPKNIVSFSSVDDHLFFSLLYKKFICKIFYSGLRIKVESLVLEVIFILSTLKVLKKPFFFTFFHLFEKLSVSFALLSKRRGSRLYSVPVPVPFQASYKKGLKICKDSMVDKLNSWRFTMKINNFFFFFFLTYLLRGKNYATTRIYTFKKKVRQNRIFAHWRWS